MHRGQPVPPPDHVANYVVRTSASKIVDGIFIGNKEAAQDFDFIMSNKISSIVNCAGSTVPNALRRFGCKYLTFRWVDCGSTVIFDPKGKTLRQISKFIDEAFASGDSVLIHSVDGNSRAACVVMGLFMIRFGWSVGKCFEFVRARRPEIMPRAIYMRQLQQCAKTLGIDDDDRPVLVTEAGWQAPCNSMEELVIRNTFLNANQLFVDGNPEFTLIQADRDCHCPCCRHPKPQHLTFADQRPAHEAWLFFRPPGAQYRDSALLPVAAAYSGHGDAQHQLPSPRSLRAARSAAACRSPRSHVINSHAGQTSPPTVSPEPSPLLRAITAHSHSASSSQLDLSPADDQSRSTVASAGPLHATGPIPAGTLRSILHGSNGVVYLPSEQIQLVPVLERAQDWQATSGPYRPGQPFTIALASAKSSSIRPFNPNSGVPSIPSSAASSLSASSPNSSLRIEEAETIRVSSARPRARSDGSDLSVVATAASLAGPINNNMNLSNPVNIPITSVHSNTAVTFSNSTLTPSQPAAASNPLMISAAPSAGVRVPSAKGRAQDAPAGFVTFSAGNTPSNAQLTSASTSALSSTTSSSQSSGIAAAIAATSKPRATSAFGSSAAAAAEAAAAAAAAVAAIDATLAWESPLVAQLQNANAQPRGKVVPTAGPPPVSAFKSFGSAQPIAPSAPASAPSSVASAAAAVPAANSNSTAPAAGGAATPTRPIALARPNSATRIKNKVAEDPNTSLNLSAVATAIGSARGSARPASAAPLSYSKPNSGIQSLSSSLFDEDNADSESVEELGPAVHSRAVQNAVAYPGQQLSLDALDTSVVVPSAAPRQSNSAMSFHKTLTPHPPTTTMPAARGSYLLGSAAANRPRSANEAVKPTVRDLSSMTRNINSTLQAIPPSPTAASAPLSSAVSAPPGPSAASSGPPTTNAPVQMTRPASGIISKGGSGGGAAADFGLSLVRGNAIGTAPQPGSSSGVGLLGSNAVTAAANAAAMRRSWNGRPVWPAAAILPSPQSLSTNGVNSLNNNVGGGTAIANSASIVTTSNPASAASSSNNPSSAVPANAAVAVGNSGASSVPASPTTQTIGPFSNTAWAGPESNSSAAASYANLANKNLRERPATMRDMIQRAPSLSFTPSFATPVVTPGFPLSARPQSAQVPASTGSFASASAAAAAAASMRRSDSLRSSAPTLQVAATAAPSGTAVPSQIVSAKFAARPPEPVRSNSLTPATATFSSSQFARPAVTPLTISTPTATAAAASAAANLGSSRPKSPAMLAFNNKR